MGTPRQDLSFVLKTEADSIFIYYLTGTLALVFLLCLLVTRSLQRKQPIVTELIHDSNVLEELVTYLVSIQTSLWPGSGCPSGVKVYMQLIGVNKPSQYFMLQSTGSSKPLLQRGFTDIFMVKVPVSVGPISSVHMVLSGLEGPLKWRIRKAEVQQLTSSKSQQIPVCIVVTERCETSTYHNINMLQTRQGYMEKLLMYHQWLAQIGNTVRCGAFTAVTHVICVFTTLTFLLDLTLVTYILLPGGEFEGQFELNYQSLLIGTLSSAFGYCCFLFLVEFLLRNVKSRIKNPGNAYHTLLKESKRLAVKYGPNLVLPRTESKEIIGTRESVLFSEDLFKTVMIWDPKFQTKTILLNRILSKVKELSDIHYFISGSTIVDESIPQFDDVYLSACDLSSHITINIPQYSGVALNHLLEGRNQGNIKGSSMLDLIHKDDSYCSVRSAFSSKSNEATESKSSDIILDFHKDLSTMRLSDFSLTRQNQSVISSVCSVDGTLFWSQYKHYRQNNKNNKPETEEENDFNVNARKESDKQNKQQVKSANVEKNIEQKQGVTGRSNKRLDEVSGSDNKLNEIDDTLKRPEGTGSSDKPGETIKSSKRPHDINTDDVDVIIDFSEVEQEFDVKLEMVEKKKSILGKSSDSKDTEEEDESLQDLIKMRMAQDRESILKSRSRKLVADICKFYRKIRVDVIEGEIIHVLPELLEWFDNIIECIILSCVEKTEFDIEEAMKDTKIMSLTVYLSGEIILYTIHNVYKALNSGNMDLPDIVVMSHSIMLSVEEVTYTLLYIIYNGTLYSGQLHIINHLDMHKYLIHLCTEFLKHCFQLIVHANELTWAYFEIYLIQTLRQHLQGSMFQDLMKFVEENLQYETVETVVLQKLCKSAIEEAKCEVWTEYSDERKIFIDLTIKQEVLDKLTSARNKICQREKAFNKQYNLLAQKKSRLQKLAEKRHKKDIKSKKKKKDFTSRWKLWKEETGRTDIPSHKDLIQYSMHLEKIGKNLKIVKEHLEKKWRRQGLKTDVDGATCLVQSLIFKHVNEEDITQQFQNYLQVKRVEQSIKEFLHFMLDDLTGFIISEAADDYNLMEFPDALQLKLVAEDICTRTNTMEDLLLQEVDTITQYALAIEDHKFSMDKSLIESTTNLIMKKSSKLLHWAPEVSEIVSDKSNTKSTKKATLDAPQHTKGRKLGKNGTCVEDSSSEDIPDDMMKGIKVFIGDDTEQEEYTINMSDQGKEGKSEDRVDDHTGDLTLHHGVDRRNVPETQGESESNQNKEEITLTKVHEDKHEDYRSTDKKEAMAVVKTHDEITGIEEQPSLQDLKTELKLMKLFLREYQEMENLRSLCTLMSYVEKQKQQRSRITNTILNNIIDSYYILEEGDDSHTFTQAGLYQVEYDTTGESRKSLPSFLKTLVVGVLFIGILLSFVMVTLVGGQFSTTQNQEYICYYLICLVEFALLFEPIRALLIAQFCDN